MPEIKTIVISAVNLRKGGTLTILRECLHYLSISKWVKEYRIVALVHDKSLAFYPNIEYIEMPDTIKSWGRRLWCEYVTMYFVSKRLAPVYLWFSLHDTTPRVKAERQAVYCQTSFPFLKRKWRDYLFDYKIVLFSLLTRLVYRIHIKKNRYLVVQADWLRKGLAEMFNLSEDRFIVAPPELRLPIPSSAISAKGVFTFFFPATPDCHKNFELLCEATRLLEKEVVEKKFQVIITVSGTENRYARWLQHIWGSVNSLNFLGFMSRTDLYTMYASTDCLVFPSRVETWGLPISEFAVYNQRMLLADLPYAHETAIGANKVAFFDINNPNDLKEKMKQALLRDDSFFSPVSHKKLEEPKASSWEELFRLLIEE